MQIIRKPLPLWLMRFLWGGVSKLARRGRRSEEARTQRRNRHRLRVQAVFSRQLVGKESHHDSRKKEVVNVLMPEEVWAAVKAEFGFVVTGLTWREQGEVMVDSRGSGSLQVVTD